MRGNKQDAKRLLPLITRPADIRISCNTVGVRYIYAKQVSLLHLAAHHGWMDIIIDLITKYKCDTNCKDSNRHTPLHYAIINDHLEVVRYFINEQYCDPMTRDNDGETPLHLAYHHGHFNIINYLISEAHYNPSCENKNDGDTQLHLACLYGHLDIAKYLISRAKCNPSCENKNGDTPLHLACHYGRINITKYLISEAHCNPSCENKNGDTPLHLACNNSHTHIVQYLISNGKVNPLAKNRSDETPMFKLSHLIRLSLLHLAAQHGWMDIIIDLITNYKCDTNCKDSHGRTPLHYAVSSNHLEVVRYFINEQHCDPMTRDYDGDTPLHLACHYERLNITKYLISEAHCNPSCANKNGDTPLHLACNHSHAHSVQYLLSNGKVNPLAKNRSDKTPMFKLSYASRLPLLHLAARNGWLDIVKDLIIKYKCDINSKSSYGHTPLHYAVINNHLEVVRYFINEQNCDPMTKDDYGNTPIHFACLYDNLLIVQYLISEVRCDPSCVNKYNNTSLHYACQYDYPQIAQFLLSTGKVDPLAENNEGKSPLDYARERGYDLLKLFQSFKECERDFPVHTYTKLILTGYSGAGKTTISQLILLLANKTGFFSRLSSGRVTDVECLTAGIIPLHVESKVNKLGNMVIYDFAGQQEYYSSHAAVLERIMRNSAAIFVCIVDLSQCMDKISESIHYWISFIENACSSAQGSSHVIIVGSHADLVKSSRELKEKSSVVESIAESRAKQLKYGGFVSMDCRLSKTKETRHFRSLLSTSQQTILSSQPSMSLYCHVLYAFLRTNLMKVGCTLQELTTALASENDPSYKSTLLTESLTSLSDKGLILFVQSQEHPQSSWVVVEKDALLREINGTLFAPENFKQYHQVASNTGIVPITTLKELFPQYSSEMLVGCLESMEFCHPVDLSTLQSTNLKATSSSPGENHLFFPGLVKEHRPDDLPSPRFGWCLGSSDLYQFFSNRFLHVLLLRLAFTFPLTSKDRSLSPSLHGLERQCEVWRNGICWTNNFGVSTIVEIVDLNRWVIVLVSEKTRDAAQTCSSVIRMILDLQHQLCSPLVTTCECLISPSLLDRYPFDALPDTDLFDLPTVARSMLLHQKLLLDKKKGTNKLSTDDALSCEPYYFFQPSSVCQLFNQSMASQPVPDPLLQEVLRYCQLPHQKPRDHNELRECVNKHSIFAGRNPLVSCSVQTVL